MRSAIQTPSAAEAAGVEVSPIVALEVISREQPAIAAELVLEEPLWLVGARRVMDAFRARRQGTTLAGYRTDLALFAQYLGLVESVTERDPEQGARDAALAIAELVRLGQFGANEKVGNWKGQMEKAGRSPRTINRRLSAIKSMLATARQIGVIAWRLDVPGAKVNLTSNREGPTAIKIATIIAALEIKGNDEALRDIAILRLLRIGLRRGEIVSRNLDHVRFDRSVLVIRGKKRMEDEDVKLPISELEAIRRWLDIRGREPGALFVRMGTGERMTGMDVWRMTRGRGREILGVEEEKLSPVRPHGLRHNATVRGLDLTDGNTAAVGSLLRHRDIRIVQQYDDKRQDRGGAVADLLSEDLDKQVAEIKKIKRSSDE